MMTLIQIGAWLAGTKVGRFTIAAFGIAVATGVFVLKAFRAGKAAERAKQDRASLENLRNRQETENEIGKLGPDDLDRRGRRWVRPE